MSQGRGFIIGVVGGKGGVGKSVIAANLAAAFQLELNQPTLLLDLDAHTCGDQNVLTGLRPNKTLGELTQFSGALTPQNLNQFILRHSGGFSYLPSVKSPLETLSIPPDLLGRTLDSLSSQFAYIIIDLGNTLTELQMAALEKTTLLLVVTTAEILAVNQTGRLLGDLSAATLPTEMVALVVNKTAPGSLNPQTIAQTLKRNFLGSLPQDDVNLIASMQRSTPYVLLNPRSAVSTATHDLVRRIGSQGLLQRLQNLNKPQSLKTQTPRGGAAAIEILGGKSTENSPMHQAEKSVDAKTMLKRRVHAALITAMDIKKGLTDTKGDNAKEQMLRQKTQQVITQIVDAEKANLPREERSEVIREVLDEALGLGPLERLLSDESVTEIMVNGPEKIFVERNGRVQLSPITFTSNLQLRNVIERIVTPLGRRIDEKTPYVDARLKDGSRVNAVIEPISLDGPAVTIRKFAKKPITINNYVEWGSMTAPMVDFLKICVENGLNVIVSGGTGSGKTTLLNVLSSFIPSNERIITVEDAAELQLKQDHVVRLETRPSNMEGTGEITIRQLIRNALRMRPDRIIVGECRGGEAIDMLSAMNTGHDGSMTTLHANSPKEAMGRLETLCTMSELKLPSRTLKEQIVGAVDLVIQISRLSDGSRKVLSITEVLGIQSDNITTQEIFMFKEEGFDKNRKIIGRFQAMGRIPTFIEEFERKGIHIPRTLFSESAPAKPVAKLEAPQDPNAKKTSGGNR